MTMELNDEIPHDDFRPRVIIWELVHHYDDGSQNGTELSTSECLLILEGIARTAKPIVVLTGPDILGRSDLHAVVQYGFALGLKMVIETSPGNLSDEVVRSFSEFGPKAFRILFDGCIVEDMETRYKQTEEFQLLEKRVQQLRKQGFEIHLGLTIRRPDTRELAFAWDYAIRIVANGLYCHLCLGEDRQARKTTGQEMEDADGFIKAMAHMKQFSPEKMYVSPQCVKYGPLREGEESPIPEGGGSAIHSFEWGQWCAAGRTFAFISHAGEVKVCAGTKAVAGTLRTNGYNFKQIWEQSKIFEKLRQKTMTCSEAQAELKPYNRAKQIVSLGRQK